MSIRVELELENGQFTTRMLHAGESVQQFRNNVNGTITSVHRLSDANQSFIGTLRDVSIVVGVVGMAINQIQGLFTGWAGDIVKVNAEMEKLQFLLKGMSRAADPVKEAAQQVKFLRDFAKDAPFSLAALSDTFVKMKSTGIDPMNGALKGLVDGIAAFGGTDEALKRATIAITQMSGKGVIQMEELRQQLGEAMPRAVELMARSMGVSMSQLIEDIGKGTLDAKTSLAAFNMELDRTFGGAAAAQMTTFNGMIARTKSLMQDLALSIGEAGFFDAIKAQVKRLNEALSGDFLKSMATTVGQGLAGVVNFLGGAVDWAVKFRNEIYMVGEALVYALGATMGAKVMLSMINLMQTMRAQAAAVAVQMAVMSAPMAGWTGMVASIRSASDALAVMQLTMTGLATAAARTLPLIISGLTLVAGWVPLVITLVAGLGMTFAKTATETEKAYEALAKYGAESRKQVDEAEGIIAVLDKRVKQLKELKAAQEYNPTSAGEGGGMFVGDGDIEKAEADAQRAREVIAREKTNGARRDAERLIGVEQEMMNSRLQKIKSAWDVESIAASENFKAKRDALIKAGKDVSSLDTEYKEQTRIRQLAYYQKEKEAYGAQLAEIQLLANGGNKDALLIQEQRSAQLVAAIATIQKQIEDTSMQAMGPVSNEKAINIQKLLEQAKQKLDAMKSSVAEQKAELEGVSGEYAKMAYLIENSVAKGNAMWRLQNTELAALVDQLKAAQVETDKFTALINGKNALDNDLLTTRQNLLTKIAEQENRGKDPLDALAVKAAAGAYSGLTPMQQLAKSLGTVNDAAKNAGVAMTDAFGVGVQDKGNSLISIVERLQKAWMGVKDNVNGIKPQGAAVGERSTFRFGTSFTDNLIARESGGNPNAAAKSSSAVGLGQFIEETWMNFLKEARPEVLEAGRQAALDARKDPTLARAAVEWYASKNANQLEKSGVTPTDSNLYLAHFLGPGGAIATLTKSTDTLLSSIPQIDAARKSNPEVFKDLLTVGDLQSWSRSFMGPLMTASRTGGSSAGAGGLMGAATTDYQRGAIMEIGMLTDKLKTLTGNNKLSDTMQEFVRDIAAASDNTDGLNKRYAAFVKLVKSGEFGADKDPLSERYKGAIELVQRLDAAEVQAGKNRKLRQDADNILKKQPLDKEAMDERDADINRRLQEESKFKFSAGYYTELKRTLQDIQKLQDAKKVSPGREGEFDEGVNNAQDRIVRLRDFEVSQAVLAQQQKTIAIEQGLMTADQARDAAHQREMMRLEEYQAMYEQGGEKRKIIDAEIARAKAAYDRALIVNSPIGKQMKEWADLSGNLQKAVTSWVDSATDKFADFVVTGKANFADFAQSILKDLVKIGARNALGGIFNSLMGGVFGGAGSGGSAPQNILGALHHTGGVAGASMPMRSVSPDMFAGAQRWHTGTGGLTLAGDEIPIIAKRGEQVDWPENLAKQYGGGGGNTIAPQFNVTVQGSPGQSAEDHARMGEQIARSAEQQIRAIVGKELMTQRKSGGIIGR